MAWIHLLTLVFSRRKPVDRAARLPSLTNGRGSWVVDISRGSWVVGVGTSRVGNS